MWKDFLESDDSGSILYDKKWTVEKDTREQQDVIIFLAIGIQNCLFYYQLLHACHLGGFV